MKRQRFDVVTSESPRDLVEQVEELLACGWQVLGPPIVLPKGFDHNTEACLLQALTRSDPWP